MFVRNKTHFCPVLARGQLSRDEAALSLNVEAVFDIGSDGALTAQESFERDDTSPPDVRRLPLWRGTSVTAFVTVKGPARPPYARTVRFIAAGRTVDVAIYGDRRWDWRLGQWVSTEPEPFEEMALGWERAFGGTLDIPPHRTSDGLPHPGGQLPFPLNPNGRGLCIDGAPVEGTLLPNIEHPQRLMRAPYEHVAPHGIAPCPALVALRFADRPSCELANDFEEGGPRMRVLQLHMLHHAPGWLIFDDGVREGDVVTLAGHGNTTVSTQIPFCPARVLARTGTRREALSPTVRSVHLDADKRKLWVTWGHACTYAPRRAPRWIELEAA